MSASVWSVPGIKSLTALTFFGFAGYAVLLPVGPLWAVHGGAGTAGAGLVNGVLLGATVLMQMVVPRLLERFGWAPVMAAGLAAMGLGGILHLAGDALPFVLALAVLRGLGFGILTVTGSSAAGLLVEPARRGAAIGAYGLAVAAPNLVLLPAGPVVVDTVGYGPAFVVAGLPLAGVPFARGLAHRIDPHHEPPGTSPRERGDRRFPLELLSAAVVLLGVTLAGGAVISFAAQIVEDPYVAAAALFILGLLAALSRWLAGGFADRHGPGRYLATLTWCTVAAMAAMAWAAGDPALGGTRLPVFVTAVAALGLSYGALQNLTLVASFAAVPRHATNTASAVWNIGFDAGTAAGSMVVGALASVFGFPPALLATVAVALLALPACHIVRGRELRREAL